MELFKNDVLKKIYKTFVEKTIFQIFECKYCNLKYCAKHYRFDCSCEQCRIVRCNNCHKFNVELDTLMAGASCEARLYIFNFVRDFFATSSITLKFFYDFEGKKEINVEDLRDITWNLRLYHGTKKGKIVEHLSKTMSFTYTIANRRYIYNLK